MSDKDRYEGKYGEKTKTWINKNEDGTAKQYNIKNTENGDHSFANTQTGVMGTALGTYRPNRDK